MIWSTVALVCLFTLTASASDDEDLEWATKYSFEVRKISVFSGFVEEIKAWHTATQSRIEYNGGAVKSFVTSKNGRRGRIYEIHPESDETQNSELVCHSRPASRYGGGPETILPHADDFVKVGEERMGDEDCSKFIRESIDSNNKQTEIFWARYDDKQEGWIPVRYVNQEFNSWLGKSTRYEIWDFEGFSTDFSDDIFDAARDLCRKEEPIRHDDDRVTKHLLLINPENEEDFGHVFGAFKKNFEKMYKDEKEHELRKSVFKRNMRVIQSTNRKNLGYKLAVNQFSDRTPEEMKMYTGLLPRKEGERGTHKFPYDEKKLSDLTTTLPSEYDLRLEGVISPIRNQQSCGSCWTFGTTSAVEGALARSNGGNLITLSQQALVDCDWEFGSMGCNGGTDTGAYQWMMKYGLPTEAEYGSYVAADGYCNINNMTRKFPIKGFVDVTPNSIAALKVAIVNHGPLSVSVHVTDRFAAYSGGVFYDFECEPTYLNHEVTLIGYGEENGETFWILKNSWGPEWGIGGYMHISAKENNCGVMTEPTYVLF